MSWRGIGGCGGGRERGGGSDHPRNVRNRRQPHTLSGGLATPMGSVSPLVPRRHMMSRSEITVSRRPALDRRKEFQTAGRNRTGGGVIERDCVSKASVAYWHANYCELQSSYSQVHEARVCSAFQGL